MLQVAIVEDMEKDAEILTEFLNCYKTETKQDLTVRCFKSALSFINDYEPEYDIILMDIILPNMNGMEASKKIREIDETACLIFVTNMADYAVEGYQVNAMDYLVKPLNYTRFVRTMDKAVNYCTLRRHQALTFKTTEGPVRMEASDIYYIRSYKHYVYIMTRDQEYRVRISMKELEDMLTDKLFFRCDNSYFVNMAHVDQIKRDTAAVGPWEIPVSRSRKKTFVNAFTCYLGELK